MFSNIGFPGNLGKSYECIYAFPFILLDLGIDNPCVANLFISYLSGYIWQLPNNSAAITEEIVMSYTQ